MAVELAEQGIRVNSVHPGLIDTPMTADVDVSSIQIPLKRAGTVSEVSNLVLYLASDESTYSTGSEFIVDGGVLAGLPKRQTELRYG
jgi:3alpha(or 20beta)-hydroxysteroid dehydrogenase